MRKKKNPNEKVNIGTFAAKSCIFFGGGGEGFTHLYMNNKPKVSNNVTSKL